jgi:MAF protein
MAELADDLPKAVVNRIVKTCLPANVQVAKEAREALVASGRIWISYVTAAANDFCKQSNRSTLSAEDVLAALDELDFDEFIEHVKQTQIDASIIKKRKRAQANEKRKQKKPSWGVSSTNQGPSEKEKEKEKEKDKEAETATMVDDDDDDDDDEKTFSWPIVLGSSSKWRAQIMAKMGFQCAAQLSPDIDEKAIRDDDPRVMTVAIARAKADALMARVSEPSILVTCDEVIVCNGTVREKPESEEQCREFMRAYEHHPAEAYCGVVVRNTGNDQEFFGCDRAVQHFKRIDDDKISELIAIGDVMQCCGGFVVEQLDGYLGPLEGEVECVEGLPVALTKRLIEQAIQSASK